MKNYDIGEHGGIRVNFISRWKPGLSKMSDDLQNDCIFFSGLEQCPNRLFMVLASHRGQYLFKIRFKENVLQKLKAIFEAH